MNRCSLAAALLVLAAPVHAQSSTIADGDWSGPIWDAGGEPDDSAHATIQNDVTVTLADEQCGTLEVTGGGELTIVSGSLLPDPFGIGLGFCQIGTSAGAGSLVQTGGLIFNNSPFGLFVGGAGTGTYEISGGTLNLIPGNGPLAIGASGTAGPGTLTIHGGDATIDVADFILSALGASNHAELIIRPTQQGAMGLSPIQATFSCSLDEGLPGSGDSILTFEPQYPVQVGDSWLLVSSSSRNGTFTTVNLPTGITADITYTSTSVVLTVTGVPTPNDDCANAIALPSTFADTLFNGVAATTDGLDASGFCNHGTEIGDQNYNDIWFTYTPDVGGCTYISTYNMAANNTRLTVYDSANCPAEPANIIACADDELLPPMAPFEAGLDVNLLEGRTYLIRIGTPAPAIQSNLGVIRIAAGPQADLLGGGGNPGAPGCVEYPSYCLGDGGDQAGCTDCPCMNNASFDSGGGCAHSATAGNGGFGARLLAEGSASVNLPPGVSFDLKLSMENMPPTSTAVMFSGSAVAPQSLANPCYGRGVAVGLMDSGAKDGLRCAVGALIRHGNRQSDLAGEIKADSGPSRTWGGVAGPDIGLAEQGGFFIGQTRYFQATFRDLPGAQCMTGLNTSQAVEVLFTP